MVDFIIHVGIIQKIITIMECLHHFYKECIEKSTHLRLALKLSQIYSWDSLDLLR